ncbi:MAG: hypothetical protein FJ224_01735 [Lentisphaerae bacterium]|nr:hypothetical protein [Lentisphaerota bacterium]
MKHTSIAFLVSLVALLPAVSALAVTALPFSDEFETHPSGAFAGNAAWTAAGVEIVAPALQKTKSAKITDGSLTFNADTSGDYTNVWMHFYCKAALSSVEPTVTATGKTVACSFYVNSQSRLRAFSSNSWQTVVASGFPTSRVGMAIHADFKNKTWDIYCTYGSVDSKLTKLNVTPLRFNWNYTGNEFSNMTVQSESPSYLDYVVARSGVRAVTPGSSASPTNMLMQIVTMTADTPMILGLIGNDFPDGDNTLEGSTFANFLKSILITDDVIKVWTTDATYDVFTLKSDGTWNSNGANPADVKITPGMAVWIVPKTSRTAFNLGAYSPDKAVPSTTIRGTNYNNKGWNQLAWTRPFASRADQSADAWGFNTIAQAGDRLYLEDQASPGSWYYLTWNASQQKWIDNRTGAPATVTMTPSQAFWVRRWNSTAENSWVSNQAE